MMLAAEVGTLLALAAFENLTWTLAIKAQTRNCSELVRCIWRSPPSG